MRIDLITLFPEMVSGFLSESMLGRAQESGLLEVATHNLRNWTHDKHNTTDDRPYGGGAGMVLKPEPLFEAVKELRSDKSTVIYMSPDGEPLNMPIVHELAKQEHLIVLSGHYEGMDERVRECIVDREISIGDYILTNGTLPAAVLIDAVARYIPGVLGEEKSLTQDAFNDNLLSFPQYTRPVEYNGMRVPEVLLSGDHAAIERWRREQQLKKTQQRRPDLLGKAQSE